MSGRHVLVEKSLATNLEHVKELVEIANSKGLALMETFQFRFHPQFTAMMDMVATGAIGDLRSITAVFSFPPFKDPGNIRYQKNLGGGALLDAGAYTLKISHILAMTKLNVLSAALHIDKARGIDLWGSAHLSDADNRVSAHLSFGFDNSYRCFAEVAGTKGRVNSERIFTAPPNFETTICQHMESGRTIQHKFAPANHFELMLAYFEKICGNREMREKEYAANLDQARLVQKVVNCSANAF
jgi:hypothetical protein